MSDNNTAELETTELQETESLNQEQATEQPDQIIDLDSVPKFRFAGKEWTPKDFEGAYMMQADYTRKTQALAEERKYYDNLTADLAKVKQAPELAEQFKSIYPKKFHSYLDYVTAASQPKEIGVEQKQSIDPKILERLDRFESIATSFEQKEIQAIEAELDHKFKALSEKYPYANEEAVLARATRMHEQGTKLTDKVWDELWKGVHTATKAKIDKARALEVNQQKQANLNGKEAGPGGGTPGQAPKVPRTIKEASQYVLQELEGA